MFEFVVLSGTGRRHQLRRHMALIGHPIFNDRRYTYGHAAQMGLCRGRRAKGVPAGVAGDTCDDMSDDSPCSSAPEAEQCVPGDTDSSDAEVRLSRLTIMSHQCMRSLLLLVPVIMQSRSKHVKIITEITLLQLRLLCFLME